MVASAGNVSRYGVEGLELASKPLACACVDEEKIGEGGLESLDVDAHGIPTVRDELALGPGFAPARDGTILAEPGSESAVENGDSVVPEVAQHPPQARRDPPFGRIVDDHLDALVDSPPGEPLGHLVEARHGVASVSSRDRSGEIAVEVRVDRARDVRHEILGLGPGRLGEIEAGIDDGPVGIPQSRLELGRLDQITCARGDKDVPTFVKTQPRCLSRYDSRMTILLAIYVLAAAMGQAIRDPATIDVCKQVPGDGVAKLFGKELKEARPITSKEEFSRCVYILSNPGSNDSAAGFTLWLYTPANYQELLEYTEGIVEKPKGLGDDAVLFVDAGDGRSKLRVLVKDRFSFEATAADADSAKKLAKFALERFLAMGR